MMNTKLRFTDRAAWGETGLVIQINRGYLCVSDLNPQKHIQNRITRWEVFRLGVHFVRRSLSLDGW